MLRRFEIYSLRPGVPSESVDEMADSFLRCSRFIPELLDSHVGRNLSDQPIDVIWEHAYESPEAYCRYMVHPYHANILDRFLLNDSPERIVTDGVLGDGSLVGYDCESPVYRMDTGVRQLSLIGLKGPDDEVEAFTARLRGLPDRHPGIVLSVVERNTFGVAWFDGVTPILPPSRWTHVWELGFGSLAAYEEFKRSSDPLAIAQRQAWQGEKVVAEAVEMHYEIV